MNRQTLIDKMKEKLNTTPKHMTDEELIAAHQSYIDYHKKTNPDEIYVIPIEEMAELTQELSKIIRGKESNNPSENIGLLEELTDVQICLDNLKIALGVNDEQMKYMIDIKMERSVSKIAKGTA